MIFNHIILATLWIIYCVLHSVLASNWIKKRLRNRMHIYKRYRLWYTLFAFVLLIAILLYQIKTPTVVLFQFSIFAFIPGIILSATGLLVMGICIRKYFMNLSGLRSLFIENFSNELHITGIHNYVRHPLYLGTFLLIWGLLLIMPYLSLLLMNTIITIYTIIGIQIEEQKLILEFGEPYRRYRQTVPKLIPFFRFKRNH